MILDSSVDFDVLWQVRFVNERFHTVNTRLWLYSQVNPHVALQWSFTGHMFVALRTFICPEIDTHMRSCMHSQFCGYHKCSFTFIAFVIFFPWMALFMFVKTLLAIHCDFTLRTCKGLGPANMFSFVHIIQVGITREWLTTFIARKTSAIVNDINVMFQTIKGGKLGIVLIARS